MNIEKSIISEIFKEVSFSPNEITVIKNAFEKVHLKKGALLLQSNETVYHQYYVSKGCLRTFFIDASGKEHTLQFAVYDWWISDYTAFFTSTKAILTIEVIQDATLYRVSKKNLESLYKIIPALETFYRKKMERAFASFQQRILSTLAESAKERYVSFIHNYPNIEQNVKNYHIASYLGITTESLSRIRKELTNT